jgi:ABC-type antimicrobial peptide transport system permease subunit
MASEAREIEGGPGLRPVPRLFGALRSFALVRAPEFARQGFHQLAAYRLRTTLALAGIVVGVGAVVGTTALIDGVEKMVVASYERLGGTRVGLLRPNNGIWAGGRWIHVEKVFLLGDEDRAAVAAAFPKEIEEICPVLGGNLAVARDRILLEGTSVSGVGASFFNIRPGKILSGRNLDPNDGASQARVALLSETIAGDLFPGRNATGEEIRVGDQRFTVIGVVRPAGRGGWAKVRRVWVPFETAFNRLGFRENLVFYWIKVRSGIPFPKIKDALVDVLVRRHPGSNTTNFQAISFGEWQDNALRSIRTQGRTLMAVAFLCLLAGGVGIMNVLLISVTERIQEIGLRIALGASRRAILGQFLIEAVLLCGIGGLVGIAAAQGLAQGMGRVVLARFGDELSAVDGGGFPLGAAGLLMGLGLAAACSVVFGIYPAWRASRLDPATSLRHE